MPVPAAKGIFRNRLSGTCQPQRCHVPGLGFLWWAKVECGGDKIWIVLRSLAFKDIKFFFNVFGCFDVISVPGRATQFRYIFVGLRHACIPKLAECGLVAMPN